MSSQDGRLRIVRASPHEAATIRSLSRDLAAPLGAPAALRITEEGWRDLLGNGAVTVLLAEVDGEPVGYASAVGGLHMPSGRDVTTLGDLFVDPRLQGSGVGSALMRALASEHPGRPVRSEMEEGNLRGQRFHLRLGARLRRAVTAWWEP